MFLVVDILTICKSCKLQNNPAVWDTKMTHENKVTMLIIDVLAWSSFV